MANVLVTGGAGFIGSHVVDRFLAAGHRVVVLDNLSSGRRANVSPNAELRVLDLQSDEARELVLDGQFTTIAHLAAQVDVRKSVTNPFADVSSNVVGTVNLLEAVRALPLAQRPRFVFASTGGALYGEALTFPTDETSPVNPDAPYGIDKLAAEHYLAYYGRVWGVESAVLRFGNVYGPRQDPHGEAGVIAIFAQRIFAGQPLTIYGSGRQTRDYIYVGDVARAFHAVTTAPLPSPGPLAARAFNIGTAVETSVTEVVAALSEIAGKKATVTHAEPRPGEIDRSVLDPAKAMRELGWRATTTLRDGLTATFAWVSDAARTSTTPA